ncbi:MAG: histidinol dehydrogenase, partial [Chloroflexi bacterium]|nr:histidinol dehydrogenase [Chloroflexota bacterium]
VYGTVDIEGLMGPTETMIVADDSANPSLCAADLLAQAEHDAMASAILVTPSLALAQRVNEAVERQLAMLNRRDIAASSLENRGGIIVVSDLDEAIDLVNFYAPEHLCLMVEDAWSQSRKVKNAGGIFIGENSPEALGDYVAGPSHVMPTGGTARFRSTLHVGDFLKTTSVIALNEATLNTVGPAAAILARAEGLTAHAKALEMRLSSSSPQRS